MDPLGWGACLFVKPTSLRTDPFVPCGCPRDSTLACLLPAGASAQPGSASVPPPLRNPLFSFNSFSLSPPSCLGSFTLRTSSCHPHPPLNAQLVLSRFSLCQRPLSPSCLLALQSPPCIDRASHRYVCCVCVCGGGARACTCVSVPVTVIWPPRPAHVTALPIACHFTVGHLLG